MRTALPILFVLVGCAPQKPPANPTAAAPESTAAPSSSGKAQKVASREGGTPAAASSDTRSLYDRLGGTPAITAVVGEFIQRNVSDPRVKFRFINVDAALLSKRLVEFVCVATGGPCKYSGRDMKEAHAGMDLVDDEFNAVVENLVGALDKFHVGAREKNEILGALGPLKPQIVAPADRFHPIEAQKLEPVEKLAKTLKPEAAELLSAAVTAGRRGQRSYAEQLFSRAELLVGADVVAMAAPAFREGAPPRVTTPLKKLEDKAPQPVAIGNSDDDEPDKKPARGSLRGVIRIDGQALSTMGVVMLEPVSGKWKKRAPRYRVLEQRDRQFAPAIMAVPLGSTVAFPNFDPIYHNVFSLAKQKPFDLGIYKNGESREVTFDKEGIIQLGCNLHAQMSAHLIVVAAPHYAVVKDSGKFWFKSLAPGRYWLKAWSDHSGEPLRRAIEIKAGANEVSVDLKNDAVMVNNDKFGTSRLVH